MDLSILFTAFTIGLLSSLHCLGMCGGIAGALTMSLPDEIRRDHRQLLTYAGAYNLGRLCSYAIAGAVVGAFGAGILQVFSPGYGRLLLRGLGFAVLCGIGLYVAGWFPAYALIEGVGAPLWRRIAPLGSGLLPARNPGRALLYGAVWGWLPCGLIYSALIFAFASGDPAKGALVMIGFGSGTLPVMMAAGLLSRWTVSLDQMPLVRRLIGLSIIVMALASQFLSGSFVNLFCVYLGI
ncbi:MAG: hypothetical protein A3G18_09510 [Rhodospirillales bacterium RIFCSPLOWO2_12_FULL_58_28]|nr:MAG: hypothetical protein A3H92_02160 [Rhodospirillales bacterium RIFCSPLOWO2_02_FULL_58_16]OHC76739.1 MAG: hypothetical protein A3G18_09510 [Rhodospirillales bacterium RIFCSPLOWO2_12_FULL_58_28]